MSVQDLPPLPAVVRDALDAARSEAPHRPDLSAAGLWLDPSWRLAQAEGIDADEFAAWVRVGRWNLAGDPAVLAEVGLYRSVAGPAGWKVAKARIAPQAALDQFLAHGRDALVASAETMLALGAGRRTEPEPAREPDPADRQPISFA